VAGRVRPEVGPPARAGLNQFGWDLTYPGATVFDCMIIWSANPAVGPKAPPGRYQVRLTANGVTSTKPFVLRRDPRLEGVTDRDLHRQFALASAIRDQESLASEAVIRIRSLRAQVRDRSAEVPGSDLEAQGRALAGKLSALEEELYQVRNRSGQDPLNFPIRLTNRLAKLRDFLETGDARPPDAYHVVFRELSAELGRHLGALERLVRDDLAAFNRAVRERGGRPVAADGRQALR
jgi:hypothetical protein